MLLFYYSYRNLLVRRLTTLLTAGGMGLVIFVFATVLMLAEGFQQTLITSGSPENAIFIRRSAETEVQSIIERKDAAILESFPQVAVRRKGGTDAAPIHLHASGVPTVVVAVPSRYVHTHNTIIDISDYTSTLKLILKLVETIDGDVAAKISSFND